MLIWLVLVGFALSGYAMLRHHWRLARLYLSQLPSFPKLPVLGNVHLFFGDGRLLFRRVAEASKIMEETNLPFVIWNGPMPMLITSDPDDVKVLTNNVVEKPYFYGFSKPCFGNGLVTAPAHIWKKNIKKLGGTFSTSVVEGYLDVFNAHSQKLVQRLKGYVGKEPFDVWDDLAITTLEAICQTALGEDCVLDRKVTTEYFNALNRVFELFISRNLNVLMHLDFIYELTPSYKELLKCVSVIHNYSGSVIKKRKQEWEDKKEIIGIQSDEDKCWKKKRTYLDILMEFHELDPTFSEEQMRAEIDTIIGAGLGTSTSSLIFLILMLGRNKHVQDKLYAELKEIFGDSTRPVQKEDLARMKYCEAVVYETLRLYPVIPVVLRHAEEELQLKSCRVPPNTACGISAWAAGRSKRFWGPDAEEFKPERWLNEEPPAHPASFLAFSWGRRPCIGKKYAITIMKTIVANCIRELEIESELGSLELSFDVTLRPVSGQHIQVRLRK